MVLRDQPTLRVVLSRDSVSAGDDIDAPHRRTLALPADATLKTLLTEVGAQGCLARIAGGQASWVARIGQQPVAVLAQQWHDPGFLLPRDTALDGLCGSNGTCEVHIEYHRQKDPLLLTQSFGGTR